MAVPVLGTRQFAAQGELPVQRTFAQRPKNERRHDHREQEPILDHELPLLVDAIEQEDRNQIDAVNQDGVPDVEAHSRGDKAQGADHQQDVAGIVRRGRAARPHDYQFDDRRRGGGSGRTQPFMERNILRRVGDGDEGKDRQDHRYQDTVPKELCEQLRRSEVIQKAQYDEEGRSPQTRPDKPQLEQLRSIKDASIYVLLPTHSLPAGYRNKQAPGDLATASFGQNVRQNAPLQLSS
jgi:hypothetical protein